MALPTDLQITPGDANKPLVLLLHGHNGDIDDMTNPAALNFHYDYRAPMQPNRDLGWSWYPHVGPYSFVQDRFKSVRSWRQALQQQGYRTAAYSQVDPTGYLARPVQQLAEVVTHLRNSQPGARIVILAHSRGGLLSRKFLKDNRNNPGLIGTIAGLITLHSPHNGSTLATVASALNTAVNSIGAAQPAARPMLEWLRTMVNAPSYQEMSLGGPFLAGLQAGETPVPGVAYATFGGTSVVLSRLLGWWYNWEGAVPQWHSPPYHLVIYQSEIVEVSPLASGPLCAQLLGGIPELRHGVGDLLTTDSGARLPWSTHRTNHLSHAEALWDPSLQQQVLNALQGIQPDGAVVRESSAAPVYVIFGGAKFWIPSPTVLNSYGGWGVVRVVPDGALAPVPAVPRDGTVVREMSSAPVYVMRGGQKCWIPDPTVLQRYGGWGAVRVVPDRGLVSIPQGPNAA